MRAKESLGPSGAPTPQPADLRGTRVLLLEGFARQNMALMPALRKLGCHVTTLNASRLDVGYASRWPDVKLIEPWDRDDAEASARVIHSHNYTGSQQFSRNFDLAVSQADHPEVFAGLRSEGEGIRLVKRTAGYLIRRGKLLMIPELIYISGCKYLGYRLGKSYRKLPRFVILRCTMNKNYWKG